ncbi:PAS domain S-box protein [Shimia sp.]|uniref:PAS domain S-box protein n=1 Tax=Shimia sp. TaxID=1954381 RepID=UPI003BAD1910
MTTAYDFFGAPAPDVADDFDTASTPISALWQVDLIEKTVWWSPAAQALHGVDPSYQPRFENAFEFCLPQYRPTIQNALHRSIQEATPWRFEFVAKRADGQEIKLASAGHPVCQDGKTTQLIGHFEPLETGQHIAAKTRRPSDQLTLDDLRELHAVVDETAILSVSDAAGRILHVNKNLLRVSGYTKDELIGKNHNLMNSGHHSKAFFHRMWQTISRGKIWRGEICNRSKQGETIWFDTIIYPVMEPNGRPIRFVALRFDITEKVRTSRLISAFFDVSHAPNVILDDNGCIQRVNPAFCAASGHSKNHLLHHHISDFIAPHDHDKVTKALRKARLGQKANALQTALQDRHGSKRILDLRFTRFEGQIFGSANDITEQWQRQKSLAQARKAAEEANQSKTAFLANMSHEIRTPLNAIIGIADSLHRDEGLSARQRDLVQTIYESGDMLEGLLSDILDLSKVEAGKLQFETIPFAPLKEVSAALRLHREQADAKGVTFSLTSDLDETDLASGDPLRLRQIISNLASNAVKFTDQGHITCSLSLKKTPGKPALVFVIADSGIGFPAKAEGNVFERFQQQRKSDSRKFGGTGLGLAISSALAQNMGGALTVTSAPGEGATFTLQLPLQPAKPAASTVAAPVGIADDMNLRGCHVLIAEDSMVNQKVISLVLQSAECEITFASNGLEALEIFQAPKKPIDLVLMDMRMPVMDGEQSVRRMRAFEAQTDKQRTPILMLSANAMAHNVRDALDAGCDGHVAKPVRRDVLFGKIDSCLKAAS